VGGALGLVEGYKARQNVEQLHEHLNPRRKGKRG
jgi:diadenosine tetraphosphate (Ap4A) HIT family hydrolase